MANNPDIAVEIANLQAQVVALRLAVEGAWLSLMSSDPHAITAVARMRQDNVAAVAQLDASSDNARILRDAVKAHTDQLWGSIEWQLKQLRGEA